MFLPKAMGPAVPVIAEQARQTAEESLIQSGYLYTPWGKFELGFYPNSRRIDVRRFCIEHHLHRQKIGTAVLDVIKDEAIRRHWAIHALNVTPYGQPFWHAQGFIRDPTTLFGDWFWRPTTLPT